MRISYQLAVLLLGLVLVSCTSRERVDSSNSTTKDASAQPEIAFSSKSNASDLEKTADPVFQIQVNVCGQPGDFLGKQDASGCIKSRTLYMWGPVGEAKLIQTSPALAIRSRGCFPNYSKPNTENLYSADFTLMVKKKAKPTVTLTKTQVPNKDLNNIAALRAGGIQTFGAKCQAMREV